jgi:hypothetical protein
MYRTHMIVITKQTDIEYKPGACQSEKGVMRPIPEGDDLITESTNVQRVPTLPMESDSHEAWSATQWHDFSMTSIHQRL